MPLRLAEPQVGVKPRNWTNWDGETFLDVETGQRVFPDGTPKMRAQPTVGPITHAPGRGNVPIEDIDTGRVPSEVPEYPPLRQRPPIEGTFRATPEINQPPVITPPVPFEPLRGRPVDIFSPAQPDPMRRYRPFEDAMQQPTPDAARMIGGIAKGAGKVAELGLKGLELGQEKVWEPSAGLIGLGYDAQDQRRVRQIMESKNPHTPAEWLKAVYETAGEYERERPEKFKGEKFFTQMLTDPLNLIGIGLEPRIARAVIGLAKRTGRVAGEALETARPIARELAVGEAGAVGKAGEGAAKEIQPGDWIKGSYPPFTRGQVVREVMNGDVPSWVVDKGRGETALLPKQDVEIVKPPRGKASAPSAAQPTISPEDAAARAQRQAEVTAGQGALPETTVPERPVKPPVETPRALVQQLEQELAEAKAELQRRTDLMPRTKRIDPETGGEIITTESSGPEWEAVKAADKRVNSLKVKLDIAKYNAERAERLTTSHVEPTGRSQVDVPERPVEPPVETPLTPEPGATAEGPLTREEIRQASELGLGIQRGKEGEIRAAIAGGTVPPKPPPSGPVSPGAPPPSGSPLGRTKKMLQDARREPSKAERFQAMLEGVPDQYRAFQEAVTDRFAGLNALSPKVEHLVARLGGIGEMQSQKAVDIATSVKQALGTPWPGVADDLDAYLHLKQAIDIAAVKGDARLIPGGLKGPKEAQQALDELRISLGEARWEQIERGAQAAIEASKASLEAKVAEGLVSRELADLLLTQYPHYNAQNIIGHIRPSTSRRRISVTSNEIKRLTEEGTEKGRTSPYASIIGTATDTEAMIARNRAAREAAEELIRQGLGKRIAGTKPVAVVEGETIFRRPPTDIPGTISYFENGQRVLVEVPEWASKEARAIYESGDADIIRQIGIINALPRQAFVTYNPAWPAANLMIDYFTAALQHNITPFDEFRGLWEAIKDISGNSEVLARMRRSGAGQAGWFAKDSKDIAKIVRKSGNLAIQTETDWLKMMREAPLRLVKGYGTVMEQGTRAAVYQKQLGRSLKAGLGLADAEAQAALASRRASLDFARGGNYAKAANAVSLFLNAGIQGTVLPFRALRDSPRARWSLGAAIGANAILYAYNRQFDEYEDVPADVKRGSMLLMLPSNSFDTQGRPEPRYITFIPKVREWGLFFGTQNYILEELDKKAHEDLGRFLALQFSQSTPVDISRIVPTVPGEVAIEQVSNYDMYRQKPIVPPEMQGLPATEQYTPYTSATIKGIAQTLGLSPLRLQHAFTGLTGGTGRTATSITDALIQTLNPSKVDYRIAELAHELDQIKAPDVPPDEVALRRIEFLNSLGSTDRQAVLDLARQPSEQVPILSALLARFYGERGGELYRLGQEAAQASTGKSPQQTQQASKALGGLADILKAEQEADDAHLAANPGMAEQWRKAHTEKAIGYQYALKQLGVLFPGAAQLGEREDWTKYQNAVYTLAGAEPDRRTKGQILAAGYRAIPLDSVDPLTKDFDTFFKRREEYKAALSSEDRDLLDRTLQASMTATEKRYAKDQETLKPYWEVPSELQQANAAYAPLQEQYDTAERAGDQKTMDGIKKDLRWKAYQNLIEGRRTALKSRPDAWAAGVKWYGWKREKPKSGGGR